MGKEVRLVSNPTVVQASGDGRIRIPSGLRARYGIGPGTPVEVRDTGTGILLTIPGHDPVSAGIGILRGSDSLTAALLEERAADRRREEPDPHG